MKKIQQSIYIDSKRQLLNMLTSLKLGYGLQLKEAVIFKISF